MYFKVPVLSPRISAQKGRNLGLKVKPRLPKIMTLYFKIKISAMRPRINAQRGPNLGLKVNQKTIRMIKNVLYPLEKIHAKWNMIR